MNSRNITTSSLFIAALLHSASSYSFIGTRSSLSFTQQNHVPISGFTSTTTYTTSEGMTMKISKGKSKHSKGNTIQTLNQQRKRLAGRRGTKHFMDPNNVG